jgi:serine/threonine-protein kinase
VLLLGCAHGSLAIDGTVNGGVAPPSPDRHPAREPGPRGTLQGLTPPSSFAVYSDVIRLYGLGATRLEAARTGADRVLAQPKRFALLVYLAWNPGSFHRRESLVGLLWPDADEARARAALRNALYFLRRQLGDEVLLNRGDGEVGLASDRFWFDAAAFESAVTAGRQEEALTLYRGDLLPGFFVPGTPEFEEWLDGRRAVVRRLASEAAAASAKSLATEGELQGAVERARRACALSPFDETTLRQLVRMLDAAGDRAGALDAYGEFRERLLREFELAPSPETEALVRQLRERRSVHAEPGDSVPSPGPGASEPHARPTSDRREDRPGGMPSRAVRAAAVTGLLVLAVGVVGVWRSFGDAPANATVVVLPMENATGNSELDYLAEGLAFTATERLAAVRTLVLVPGSGTPTGEEGDPRAAALALGGSAALSWSLVQVDSGLVIRAELQRASDGRRLWHCDCPVRLPDLLGTEEPIVEAVLAHFDPSSSKALLAPPMSRSRTPETRILHLKARHFWSQRSAAGYWKALGLLQRAIDEDPGNAQAYAWMAATFGAMAVYGHLAPHETFRRAEAAAERALVLDEGLADAHNALGALRALYYWDWAGAEKELRRALELNPDFAEAHNVLAHMYRAQGRYEDALPEARAAARLDPLEPYYGHHVGILLFCGGREQEAIDHLLRTMRFSAGPPIARQTLVASWTRLGLPDSALATWKAAALAAGDSLETRLLETHGDRGLVAVLRAAGRAELAAIEVAKRRGDFVAPMRRARALARAGFRDEALQEALRAVEERDPQVLFLRCDPAFDALRDDPRLEEAARRIGLP